MTDEQPNALRLADALEGVSVVGILNAIRLETAAAELRRQHEEIERLRGIVPEFLEELNDKLCDENERLTAQRDVLLALLGNIRGWDMLDATADGVYWKREIDAAIRAVEENT